MQSETTLPERFATPESHSHFFGYYDKSPLDRAGERLLCHRLAFDGRDVTLEDTAEVGYYELGSGTFRPLGTTSAFNLQQGSMLQWLPPDHGSRVVFNERRGDGCGAVIVNVETGARSELDGPIYAVHPSGAFALTLAFERLACCRPGYHYPGVRSHTFEGAVPDADGIFRVDLNSGVSEPLLSLAAVCAIAPRPGTLDSENWLDHIMWNRSGTRFAFMHRRKLEGGEFWSRLLTADTEGRGLHLFPDTGVYSHMGWRGDDALTVWTLIPNAAANARAVRSKLLFRLLRTPYRTLKRRLPRSMTQRFVPRGAFVHFQDQQQAFDVVGAGRLLEDGHNSWTRDGRYMWLDTYEDPDGYRHLLRYDRANDAVAHLGRFRSPFNRSGHRCDLHPRLSHDERAIVIDSAHSGRRQVYVMDTRPAGELEAWNGDGDVRHRG